MPDQIDWICMSPKANTEIKLKKGNEIKVIFPQESLDPEKFSLFDLVSFIFNQWTRINIKKI